jgi:hypothetical protein
MMVPTDFHPSPVQHFKTSLVFLISFPKCPGFSTIKSYTPNVYVLIITYLRCFNCKIFIHDRSEDNHTKDRTWCLTNLDMLNRADSVKIPVKIMGITSDF